MVTGTATSCDVKDVLTHCVHADELLAEARVVGQQAIGGAREVPAWSHASHLVKLEAAGEGDSICARVNPQPGSVPTRRRQFAPSLAACEGPPGGGRAYVTVNRFGE
ncbi:hypothetical protein EVAR_18077_1 [Eumeta japonica]|uniref:Uncharacterized protein n=1 Tax=Eumeta variegata TaxID=151549 RepID=A0A4C1VGG0_EUMVA|nr:hypothetical protein EVAR_18077_1 [Eumeta japonica]